jgi:putative nucleotidyltransferase with HDIG domain
MEVFCREKGFGHARQVASDRSGKWFDPTLVAAFESILKDNQFVDTFLQADPQPSLAAIEPIDEVQFVNDEGLDRIAKAFAQVVDAKSPWTFRHSTEVAKIATGMAEAANMSSERLRVFRRAALLHDIGKLGISNLILDKPGKMTDEEFAEMKKHPRFTQAILNQVASFSSMAEIAGAHHERLDGKGYFQGIPSATLPQEARILMVADVFEAMTAARPYRDAIPPEKVVEILSRDTGTSVCPESFELLKTWLLRREFESRIQLQEQAIESLIESLDDCPSC